MDAIDNPKILVVDDVEANRFALRDIIRQTGYTPVLAENGEQALKVVERFAIQLIVLDIAMPGMDGFEVCRRLKEDVATRDIPVIFMSALDNPQDITRGFEIGGADYIVKPFVPEIIKARVRLHLNLYDSCRQLQDLNHKLQISVAEQVRRVEKEKKNVLYALLRVARENAAYDDRHMERISKNCRVLTEAMQLTTAYADMISDQYVDTIELAAPICDIGNVAVPTEILQKKDRLTEEENKVMQRHTIVGARILQGIEDDEHTNDFIQMSLDIVKYHHENWDGSGYPRGLSGEEIPLCARIMAVADVFDAVSSKRCYRDAMPLEDCFKIILNGRGTDFDPDVVDAFMMSKEKIEDIIRETRNAHT